MFETCLLMFVLVLLSKLVEAFFTNTWLNNIFENVDLAALTKTVLVQALANAKVEKLRLEEAELLAAQEQNMHSLFHGDGEVSDGALSADGGCVHDAVNAAVADALSVGAGATDSEVAYKEVDMEQGMQQVQRNLHTAILEELLFHNLMLQYLSGSSGNCCDVIMSTLSGRVGTARSAQGWRPP